MPTPEMDHRLMKVNGLQLHVACAGPEDGRPVVLLHGFPEFWYGWRHQIGPLTEVGYRVIVPDQRGFNLSDKPQAVGEYSFEKLGEDVCGILDAFGYKRAHIIGHDWGGAVAWWLASERRKRVDKLVVLNCPHPKVLWWRMLTSLDQFKRTSYMLYFQLPAYPEDFLEENNFAELKKALRANAENETAFTDEDLELYEQAWKQPEAITAMLNYYRAGLRTGWGFQHDKVFVPTLLIWGRKDKALPFDLAQPSIDMCTRGWVQTCDNAGHFVQHDAHWQVNQMIYGFIRDNS